MNEGNAARWQEERSFDAWLEAFEDGLPTRRSTPIGEG